jgi:hypothetical protein
MKQPVVTLLMTMMCLAVPTIAQQKIRPIQLSEITGNAPEETKKEILKIEEEHSMAVWNHDTAALERLLAANWAYTNERGEVLTKEQWINNIKNSKFGMDTIIHDDIRMDQFGDTVVLMGRSTSTLHYNDKTSHGPRRFELVFARMNGTWKLVGHFVSLVPAAG